MRERDNVVYWKTKRKINNDLQLVRDLKSVAAKGSLAISKPVIIPIGLLLAMLWLTGKKGVRSVLLESPVARAVTRTMVQASSEMS